MICAENFGCSGKVPYAETRQFADAAGLGNLGNFSRLSNSNIIVSIDRVSRCAVSWKAFAQIAFSHAGRDIEVGLGIPSHAIVCFEFGEDASSDDRAALVESVHEVTKERGIVLGKCHSAVTGSDVTSLVVALFGESQSSVSSQGTTGAVWISGPIGIAKLLYLECLKQQPDQQMLVEALANPLNLRRFSKQFSTFSDVSGHGLAGCLCDLAERLSLSIEVTLCGDAAASPTVIDAPASILENELEDYPSSVLTVAAKAMPLSLLKETAGPIIALSGELSQPHQAELQSLGWRKIGSYRSGNGSVSIGWRE